MFGANDEPGGEASICSPDVCKMVAGVIKRLREHGPLWVTASTKTLKWCTEEALHYSELFPKNTISFVTDFLLPGSNSMYFRVLLESAWTDLIFQNHHIFSYSSQCATPLLYFFFLKLHFYNVTVQLRSGTNFNTAFKETYIEFSDKQNWWGLFPANLI